MLKRNIVGCVTALLLLSQTATAGETCRPLVEACDRAIEQKNAAIRDLGVVIDLRDKQVAALTSDVEAKERQLGAFYRNPFYMLLIGAAVGVVVFR